MICEREAEYVFVWGVGDEIMMDNICQKHYDEDNWELAVPLAEKQDLRKLLESLYGT